jgi:hypothetical protein
LRCRSFDYYFDALEELVELQGSPGLQAWVQVWVQMHGDAAGEARQGAKAGPVLRLSKVDAVNFMLSGTIHFGSVQVRLVSRAKGFASARRVTDAELSALMEQGCRGRRAQRKRAE